MATQKVKGLGTILQVKIGSVFTTIGQRVSIEGPDASVAIVTVTDLDSVAVEKRASLPDYGDLSMQIWFDPNDTVHTQLLNWIQTPPDPPPQWKLVFASTPVANASFSGILSGFKVGGMTTDGYLTGDIKISITGAPVWGTGSTALES